MTLNGKVYHPIKITTSKLTKTSHYTKKQQKLYDKIKELKEVEKLSYKKISDKLEKLKCRSVRSGKILKPNIVSIPIRP